MWQVARLRWLASAQPAAAAGGVRSLLVFLPLLLPPSPAGLVFTGVGEFARTIHVKEEPAGGAPEGAAAAPVKQEGGGGEEDNYGLGDEAMETDAPGEHTVQKGGLQLLGGLWLGLRKKSAPWAWETSHAAAPGVPGCCGSLASGDVLGLCCICLAPRRGCCGHKLSSRLVRFDCRRAPDCLSACILPFASARLASSD